MPQTRAILGLMRFVTGYKILALAGLLPTPPTNTFPYRPDPCHGACG